MEIIIPPSLKRVGFGGKKSVNDGEPQVLGYQGLYKNHCKSQPEGFLSLQMRRIHCVLRVP